MIKNKQAFSNSIPVFEIENNSFFNKHEAKTFTLDLEIYYYLKTKGLDELQSDKILISSFSFDILSKLPDEFWNGYNGGGEPYGLINIALSRKIGRIKDGEKYPDPNVEGYNPCAEQSLANYETCCLSEIYLCNIDNYEELKDIATIVYRICKHSLLLGCHQEETEKIVHKNLRMGIGITGYLQSSQEQKSWLNDLYEYLREYDNYYSDLIGVPRSVKLTTVKPSGTLSLLAGVTSGAHPAIYQYFIRRIRVSASNRSLLQLARKHKYFIEFQKNFDGLQDLIKFPDIYYESEDLLIENFIDNALNLYDFG